MFRLKALFILLSLACDLVLNVPASPLCGVCSSSPDVVVTRAVRASSISKISPVGEKKVLYLRLNYLDDLAEPISAATADSRMSDVSHFFRAQSFGKCWTKSTVTPLLTLPSLKTEYFPTNEVGQVSWDPQQMLSDALALARAAGFNPADYELHLLRFNAPFLRSWGYIGTSGAWLATSDIPTTIHEIGHNLGLHHANSWSGPLNGPGTNQEYDDPYDLMGYPFLYQSAGFNAINKTALGWLTEPQSARVTASGIYRIYAHDTNQPVAGRKYVLRIRKDDERDYWIEKRQQFDLPDEMKTTGLLLYWDAWSESNAGTQLLDPSPAEGFGWPVSELLVDAPSGVRVVPLRQSEDRSFVEVAVLLGAAPLNILPGLLHFAGIPHRSYALQSSVDLRNWREEKQLSSASGELLAPISTGSNAQFFRVRPLD